jgi:single-strand DNA-binding protein
MNALRNSVRLIGHLGDAPKVIQFESGRKIVNFSIATNETYVDNAGNRKSETTWHRLVANGKLANLAEKYLQKGTEVAVEGKLTNRSWDDKEGKKHYMTEVFVSSLMMLKKKNVLESVEADLPF